MKAMDWISVIVVLLCGLFLLAILTGCATKAQESGVRNCYLRIEFGEVEPRRVCEGDKDYRP